MPLSIPGLIRIAAVGGVATVTMGLLARGKVHYNIKQMEFYKDAMATVRHHKGAVALLGEPIKDKNTDIDDQTKNFTREGRAQYEVPVMGPKARGYVYFLAEQDSTDGKWVVNRIELGLKEDDTKRLLIKSLDKEQNASIVSNTKN